MFGLENPLYLFEWFGVWSWTWALLKPLLRFLKKKFTNEVCYFDLILGSCKKSRKLWYKKKRSILWEYMEIVGRMCRLKMGKLSFITKIKQNCHYVSRILKDKQNRQYIHDFWEKKLSQVESLVKEFCDICKTKRIQEFLYVQWHIF